MINDGNVKGKSSSNWTLWQITVSHKRTHAIHLLGKNGRQVWEASSFIVVVGRFAFSADEIFVGNQKLKDLVSYGYGYLLSFYIPKRGSGDQFEATV
jgi:hypothetical protein